MITGALLCRHINLGMVRSFYGESRLSKRKELTQGLMM